MTQAVSESDKRQLTIILSDKLEKHKQWTHNSNVAFVLKSGPQYDFKLLKKNKDPVTNKRKAELIYKIPSSINFRHF